MLANENDGNGREGYMRYLDGIGSAKKPEWYGDLLLCGGYEGVNVNISDAKKGDYELYLYSRKQSFENVQPMKAGGVYYIPGGEFLRTIGAEFKWQDKSLEIKYNGDVLIVTKEKLTAIKNGEELTFFAPPIIIEDRIMLPTDALAALGFHFYTDSNKLYIY